MTIDKKLIYRIKLVRNNILRGKRLYDFAKEHSYGKIAVHILSNKKDIPEDVQKCLLEQENSKSLKHRRDNRSTLEYNLNLILGWIVEDYIVDNSSGVFVLNGSDKEREILVKDEVITHIADLKNTISGRPVEVHTEYFTKKDATVQLRDHKYLELKKAEAEILIINIPKRTYILKKVSDFKAEYVKEYAPFGNKPVYSLSLENKDMYYKPLDNLFSLLQKRVAQLV